MKKKSRFKFERLHDQFVFMPTIGLTRRMSGGKHRYSIVVAWLCFRMSISRKVAVQKERRQIRTGKPSLHQPPYLEVRRKDGRGLTDADIKTVIGAVCNAMNQIELETVMKGEKQ